MAVFNGTAGADIIKPGTVTPGVVVDPPGAQPGPDSDLVFGGGGDDVIDGGKGDDRLLGDKGDDTIVAGRGDDYLSGGEGRDLYLFSGEFGQDVVAEYYQFVDTVDIDGRVRADAHIEVVGHDLIVTIGSNTITIDDQYVFGDHGRPKVEVLRFDDVTLRLKTIEESWTLHEGTVGDDTDIGSVFDDTTYGFGGEDTLLGDTGDDLLFGGDGDDVLQGNDGNDVLEGGRGLDRLIGDDQDDTYRFSGQWDDDTIVEQTRSGRDVIDMTGIDADRVKVELVGNDLVVTAGGRSVTVEDAYFSLSDRGVLEKLHLADGIVVDLKFVDGDWLDKHGTVHDDDIHGTVFGDTIAGRGGSDVIAGDAGGDTIDGGAGDDVLSGGGSDDVLRGGGGSDLFVFDGEVGSDRVLDFTDGVDRLQFSGFAPEFSTVAEILAAAQQVGDDVVITLRPDDSDAFDTYTLENVDLADLDETDFLT